MHPHTKYHWPISKDKNVMARTRKYYLKNNYCKSVWDHWQQTCDQSHIQKKCDIGLLLCWFYFCFFCFFSAKLVRTITFLSFQIGQWYLVCGCMTIRRCVAYHNDLCGTLTFDLKKHLFDLVVKGQGPTKVIMVRDTPPYGHAPIYQISLTYLERQKCYGPYRYLKPFFLVVLYICILYL
jgi:hypothetical protein